MAHAAHHNTGSRRDPRGRTWWGRQWRVQAPNLLEVSDFKLCAQFGYTAADHRGAVAGGRKNVFQQAGALKHALRAASFLLDQRCATGRQSDKLQTQDLIMHEPVPGRVALTQRETGFKPALLQAT